MRRGGCCLVHVGCVVDSGPDGVLVVGSVLHQEEIRTYVPFLRNLVPDVEVANYCVSAVPVAQEIQIVVLCPWF